MFFAYPNPTYGNVTIEFGKNFPFKDMTANEIGLYYRGTKINTWDFSSVKDNKLVISSEYLQQEGKYMVFITESNIFTSFNVIKK